MIETRTSSIAKNLTVFAITVILLTLSSCANYRASTLSYLSEDTIRSTSSNQENIIVTAKAFDKSDCKRYLDRDVIKQGYQPLQLYIQNNSEKSYIFSLSRLNVSPVGPDEVAETVHTSTVGRAAAYGAGALILWPLVIPAIIDGVKSAEANNKLDMDFAAKAAKDTVIQPHSQMNTLLFVSNNSFQENLTLTLIEQGSREPLSFEVKVIR